MFWVDEITEDIIQKYPHQKKFIVRDEKTLSGRVHVGSLRGFVIHGVIAQALKEKGLEVEYIFEFNDADPMDGLPAYLDQEKYRQFMGQPLYTVPSPVDGFENFAEYYGDEFLKVINKLGFFPKIIRARDLYQQGHYDKWIKKIIQHPAEIRKIYQEVSGSEKPEDWYPLQVVCENCGKIGSTKVTGIDGGKVTYECLPDMVSWAKGCGHHGVTSPYGGRGKLPWKVEWPVKWASLGVNIEGAGKDHSVAGGSRDISARIATEILGIEVPYNIPYEHFLIGGRKMSSSKGLGASSKEISDLLPPELLRFLMSKTHFSRPIDFNPYGTAVPVLFDQYDESAGQFFSSAPTFPDQGRAFYFSQVSSTKPVKHFLPRFSKLMFYLQLPRINPLTEFEKNTHQPLNEIEKKELETRSFYAKQWLENYAPEEFKFEVKPKLPPVSLSKDQKEFLKQIVSLLQQENLEGEKLHAKIHEIRKNSLLPPRDAFQAIYLSLLGKDSGPQAGWFLESLDKNFVIQRFLDAKSLPEEKSTIKVSSPQKPADPSIIGWKNNNIVIGQIEGITLHPNAKGLIIYQVKISKIKSLSIISGCDNPKIGDIVAVALKNARIFAPDGGKTKVEKGRIRGYESEAVLCSPLELGLGNDNTKIHLLDPSLVSHLGEPVGNYLNNPMSTSLVDHPLTIKNIRDYYLIDEPVKQKFPKIKTGCAVLEGISIKKSDPELVKLKEKAVQKYKSFTEVDLAQLKPIVAYRQLFKQFGVDWKNRRPSPDALLKRLIDGKNLYTINTLVDAYNVVCLTTNLGMGALDLDHLKLPVVLRLAKEGEKILLLGGEDTKTTKSGELIYSDQEKVVTLDLNYRDCDQTKITTATKQVLIFVDGCEGISQEEISQSLDLMIELITKFCGGVVVIKAIVS